MEDNKPIYDERVEYILRGLAEGKSREDLAEELEYSTYKSLDIYMRRKNFRFDSNKKTYLPDIQVEEDIDMPSSSKIMEVISLLSKEGNDPKTVAKRLGYKSHIEMAEYMKAKGYVYDGDISNYVKKTGEVEDTEDHDTENNRDINPNGIEEKDYKSNETITTEGMEKYIPILNVLFKNRDKLIDLLMPQVDTGKIPRYVVGGTFVTKSVHMSNKLDRTIRDFSREKGINQREIFEVALIEFFRKYGYEAEAEMLIS